MGGGKVRAKLVDAVSSAADFASSAVPCPANGHLSLELTHTGAASGSHVLQVSHDGGSTFVECPGASTEFTTSPNAQPNGSNAGTIVANFTAVPGSHWRYYWDGSGVGTITVKLAQGDMFE